MTATTTRPAPATYRADSLRARAVEARRAADELTHQADTAALHAWALTVPGSAAVWPIPTEGKYLMPDADAPEFDLLSGIEYDTLPCNLVLGVADGSALIHVSRLLAEFTDLGERRTLTETIAARMAETMHTAPCGDQFESRTDADDHEIHCGACIGAVEQAGGLRSERGA